MELDQHLAEETQRRMGNDSFLLIQLAQMNVSWSEATSAIASNFRQTVADQEMHTQHLNETLAKVSATLDATLSNVAIMGTTDLELADSIVHVNTSLTGELRELRAYVDASLPEVTPDELMSLRDFIIDKILDDVKQEERHRVGNDSQLAAESDAVQAKVMDALQQTNVSTRGYARSLVEKEAVERMQADQELSVELQMESAQRMSVDRAMNESMQVMSIVMKEVRDRIRNATFQISTQELMAFSMSLFDNTMSMLDNIQHHIGCFSRSSLSPFPLHFENAHCHRQYREL
jgi:hypothetical protein